jgi:hypothetical protein
MASSLRAARAIERDRFHGLRLGFRLRCLGVDFRAPLLAMFALDV